MEPSKADARCLSASVPALAAGAGQIAKHNNYISSCSLYISYFLFFSTGCASLCLHEFKVFRYLEGVSRAFRFGDYPKFNCSFSSCITLDYT